MQRREFLITSAAVAGAALSGRALGKKGEPPSIASGQTAVPTNNKIVELMQVADDRRDLSWLRQSLQAALEVELSTLPPYLCGMWSIATQAGPAYDLVYRVAIEEMLHMGLDCNMLTAIGGTPQIFQAYQDRIRYPGHVPGGVRPQLTVHLAGLTLDYLKDVYMQLEYPEIGPLAGAFGHTYPTVGAFYGAILEAFRRLAPELTTTNQLTSSIGLYVIATLDDVERAIMQIKEQGEGTSQSPLAQDFGRAPAHYYKFAEILHGRTLVQVKDQWLYAGDPIPFPDVYPVAPIPAGGYPDPSDEVVEALQAFNEQFATLLTRLENAWATGSTYEMGLSVSAMFRLKSLARRLMNIPLPDQSGVYGPDFRCPR